MKNSFKILTILGIPVYINISWFIILGLVIYVLSRGVFPSEAPGYPKITYLLMAAVAAILLFTSLLLHELSHSVVAKRNKIPIAGITLFVFGGVAQMEKEPSSAKIEFKMAIAGPLMSLGLALLFFTASIIGIYFKINPIIIVITKYLTLMNSIVAIFNLAPGFPLDGGRILRAGLWYFMGDLQKATYIASGFGKALAFIIIGLGFFSLLTGNFISGIWFIFIGIFLQEAADTSYKQLLMKKMFSRVIVSDVMSKEVIWVPAAESIDSIVHNYIFRYRHSSFPVMEDDKLIGLLTFHDVKEIPKSEWTTTKASDIALPITKDLCIRPRSHITSALPLLAKNGIGRLLVIENNKIAGILSQKDIIRLFEIKSHLDEK
ncbi:MAG: site-2 protease family protein [Candidatus Saganbacteria bacterium]|nr:site-2 protease family protein [Candidatus Saganbacteria bacterium]